MQQNRGRLGQGDINEAAARIRRLLEQEEQDQRLEQVMVDRLRASGWQPNLPPAPAAGPSLADAAQAIEAQLNHEDAYRTEAQRRLAAEAPRGSAVQPVTPPDADRTSGDWKVRTKNIADRFGLDEDQLIAAGPEILPTLGGLFSYRHLDRQRQHQVMQEIERWKDVQPQLYRAMRGKIADILVQPEWEPWSMSDDELPPAYNRNKKVNDVFNLIEEYDTWSDVPGAESLIGAGVGGALAKAGGKTGGSLAFIAYEIARRAFESATIRMEKEADRRGLVLPD